MHPATSFWLAVSAKESVDSPWEFLCIVVAFSLLLLIFSIICCLFLSLSLILIRVCLGVVLLH